MSALVSQYSLLEQQKRINPDGTQARIVEVLNRGGGGLMQDAPWLPSNDTFTNKTVQRASLPTGSRRQLNQRVSSSVSRVTERNDVIENIEDFFSPDTLYIDSQPNPMQALAMESDAFIEGLGQTALSDILYGDADADPDRMHGLAARLGTVDGRFVFDGGGTGSDVTSIYVVTWDPMMCHLMYPKNMAANLGVQMEDLGKETSETTGGLMRVYRQHFMIRMGLVVRHPRAIGRYANIEVTGTSNLFDEDNLIKLTSFIKRGPGTRIYCNDSIAAQMQIAAKDKTNINYTLDGGQGLSGEPLIRFNGIPVRVIDREILLNTETAIS